MDNAFGANMKLVSSNGKTLEVRDISEPLITIRARKYPTRHNGYRIVEDDVAREIIKDYLETGLYDKI